MPLDLDGENTTAGAPATIVVRQYVQGKWKKERERAKGGGAEGVMGCRERQISRVKSDEKQTEVIGLLATQGHSDF